MVNLTSLDFLAGDEFQTDKLTIHQIATEKSDRLVKN